MVSTCDEYRDKRNLMISFLGGSCAVCGTTENLHIDHIDHMDKNFDISSRWSWSWNRLEPEMKKCQLLCSLHHKEKTMQEGSLKKAWTVRPRGVVHGTVWGYNRYKCRCDLCKNAKSEYEKLRKLG